jgi:hypothetical protein
MMFISHLKLMARRERQDAYAYTSLWHLERRQPNPPVYAALDGSPETVFYCPVFSEWETKIELHLLPGATVQREEVLDPTSLFFR